MSGVQSIERSFTILRALAGGPLGVTDLAEATALPKSTVSRLLAALEAEQAIEQLEAGGVYGIGPSLATLAGAAGPDRTLRSVVRPSVELLVAATGGSAGLTVLDGDEVFWVDDVAPDDEVVLVADHTGQSFPLHTVPSGLAILSHADDERVEAYLAGPLPGLHEASVTDPDVLRTWIADARADGLVISRQRTDPGVTAYAAAFRTTSGAWDAALYVQGPSFRFPVDGDEAHVIELLRSTTAQLTSRLARA